MRTTRQRRAWVVAAALAIAVALSAGCALRRDAAPAGPPPELWFYDLTDLSDAHVVDRLTPLWIRARRAGYRRVVLADVRFARLRDMGDAYFEHARRLKALADSIGLGIVPGVFQVGRSSSMLAADPNLVEALPVANARFEVSGGTARLVPDPPVAFADAPAGKDTDVRVTGRVATIEGNRRHARWWYDVPVSPHRSYRVSVWIRTRAFEGEPLIQVLGGRRVIHFMKSLGVRAAQDWTEHSLVFNSLEHSKVRVYMGVWRPTRGRLEWRDWTIEETGPVNLVRRPGAPFALRDEASGRALVEGRDFAPVADTLMGRAHGAGSFEEWHESPQIHVRTSLPDGTRLRASWHQAAIVYEKQVTCCLSEPGTFELLRDEARRMRELWGPGRYLMMFDEIRALGRDSACVRTGRTPARILAEAVKRCAAYLPDDTLYVWNDMFDPHHNAVDGFFLVRGDLAGAWEGLPDRVSVVNWNGDHARASLQFFARRGHGQVIAGYYDAPPDRITNGIKAWLAAARGVPRVEAVMYTTWKDRYDDLEALANACRVAANSRDSGD